MEHDKIKQSKELEMEVLKQKKLKMFKLEVQQYRLDLIKEGKLSSDSSVLSKDGL